MIISKAPFRMSFFGGGTDYQAFFEEYGGSVISSSFDKYVYVTVRHLPNFFEYKNMVSYSKIERVMTPDEIQHPLIRESMKFLNMHDLHIAYDADLPARTGLGTSSSFACAMLQAFHALKGHYTSPYKLAQEAIHVERVLCNESGGWQDQVAAAYGGFNRIDFKNNDFKIHPIIMSKNQKEKLNKNLMLFFTGFTRLSSEIAKEQSTMDEKKMQDLKEMLSIVDVAESILVSKKGDFDEFGRLLDYSWSIKRGISNKVTTDNMDEIYSRAMKNGALGGKLLGAGGGGFFLFYVPEEYQENVKKALSELLYVPFEFEEHGAEILYYKPEDYDLNCSINWRDKNE